MSDCIPGRFSVCWALIPWNLPQSEECEKKREKEYQVIEKILHFANLLEQPPGRYTMSINWRRSAEECRRGKCRAALMRRPGSRMGILARSIVGVLTHLGVVFGCNHLSTNSA